MTRSSPQLQGEDRAGGCHQQGEGWGEEQLLIAPVSSAVRHAQRTAAIDSAWEASAPALAVVCVSIWGSGGKPVPHHHPAWLLHGFILRWAL